MLHIDDVNERLDANPEPKEVKEIRENIIKSFSKLEFVEEGHKYYVHNDDGTLTTLPSVSHVCHQFEPQVDWDVICENKAKKLNSNRSPRYFFSFFINHLFFIIIHFL